MTLVVEIGSGIREANSYVSVAFITAYLTQRSRETENNWNTATVAQHEAAATAATQYIDTRWGGRFKGTQSVFFSGELAQALVDFDGQPGDGDTITLGQQLYTFRTVLGTALENGEVLIGVDVEASAQNFIDAVKGGDGRDTTYSKSLQSNRSAGAVFDDGSTSRVVLEALSSGVAGNDIILAKTAANITIAVTFVNGIEATPQPLQFPRINIWDPEGLPVFNIPLKLQHATAEYAVRARASELYQDPTVDASGKSVVELTKRVGPISTSTKYERGSSLSQLLRPYPAADRLLSDYILPAGRAIR